MALAVTPTPMSDADKFTARELRDLSRTVKFTVLDAPPEVAVTATTPAVFKFAIPVVPISKIVDIIF